MTKENFKKRITHIIITLLIIIIVGILLSVFDKSINQIFYKTFKDLIPLFLAIVASLITYAIQKRLSFLNHLRSIWSKTVFAVQSAAHFCDKNNRTEDDFYICLRDISIAIDEIRGIYINIKEDNDSSGIYPFEPIKEVYALFKKYGMSKNIKASYCKKSIFILWKSMRKEFLKEFERQVPFFTHSHWINEEKLTLSEYKISRG